jgi:2-oxoglutarate dehydrogenase E1 component
MRDSVDWLDTANLDFAEDLYERFLSDPESVPPDWRQRFLELSPSPAGAGAAGPSFSPATVFHPTRDQCRHCAVLRREADVAARQDRVDQLVRAYRVRGHLVARLDPLGLPRAPHPELEASFYGLTEDDMDRVVSGRTIFGAGEMITLREVLRRLRDTYCRSIGVQFMHIDDLAPKMWLQ